MENYESLSGSHHCFHGFGVRHWIVMRVELHLNHCYLKWTIGFKKLSLSWWTLFGHLIFVWSFLSSLLKLQNTLNYIRKWENRPLLTGIMLFILQIVSFSQKCSRRVCFATVMRNAIHDAATSMVHNKIFLFLFDACFAALPQIQLQFVCAERQNMYVD